MAIRALDLDSARASFNYLSNYKLVWHLYSGWIRKDKPPVAELVIKFMDHGISKNNSITNKHTSKPVQELRNQPHECSRYLLFSSVACYCCKHYICGI